MNRIKHILILPFLLLWQLATAQIFPVQVNTQLLPPYTPYLSDYTSPGSQKMMVQLRVNDPTVSDYACKLRLTIEGVGITIRTKANFLPQPIRLQGGGIPQIFYGEDLGEYFLPNNLDFSGITRREYEKGARLPEGVYRFTVEVLDYNRGTLVSNRGTAMAWIVLNDPPLLNLPRTDAKVTIIDPTNIAFTWTPRHTGSPNSAFSSEYIFKLVEIWPINRNPNDAFLSQQPLYETTTTNPQLIYGPAEPALIPGRKYAWQVQARDLDGRDLFRNQGKSEVYAFQFGDALGVPENLRSESANASTVSLRWEPSAQGEIPQEYRVRYRPKGKATGTWYETSTRERWLTLPNLQSESAYEVQVRAEAKPQVSEYSPMQVVSTTAKGLEKYTCGQESAVDPASDTIPPLPELNPGDFISCRNFNVYVAEVSGSNGNFTGTGRMQVPFFNMANVKVTFSGIKVNNRYELTAGEIITTYNAGSAMGQVIDKAEKIGEEKPQLPADKPEEKFDIVVPFNIVDVTDISVNPEAKTITFTDEEGKTTTQEYTPGKAITIKDADGDIYAVDEKGEVKHLGKVADGAIAGTAPASGSGVNTSLARVTFSGSDQQKYGFDKKEHDALAMHYGTVQNSKTGSTEYISWKSVEVGQLDAVSALISEAGTGFDKSKIKFITPAGNQFTAQPGKDANTLQTSVLAGIADGEQELYAHYATNDTTNENLGVLKIITYEKILKKVVLVSLGGAATPSADEVKKELNKIYGQAVAEWDVQIGTEAYTPEGWTSSSKVDAGSSGILSNYSDGMRTIINGYKEKNKNLDNKAYYLFFANEATDAGLEGYMPRAKQFGFIFTKGRSVEDVKITIAHELGHGAFHLRHTFDEGIPKNTSDNLMDYAGGTKLKKYQWDFIHLPEVVLGVLEGDEDGESSLACFSTELKSFFEELKRTYKEESNFNVGYYCTPPFSSNLSESCFNYKLGDQNLIYISSNFKNVNEIAIVKDVYINPILVVKEKAVEPKEGLTQLLRNYNVPSSISNDYLVYAFKKLEYKEVSPLLNESDWLQSEEIVITIIINEADEEKFENYLFGKLIKRKWESSFNALTISENGIKSLIRHEAKVKYVYNDRKGAYSRYCTEHQNHSSLAEGSYKCDEGIHIGSGENLGFPTIGIGHLIVGQIELDKWCFKEPISDSEIEELFSIDIKEKAEKYLKNMINQYVEDPHLTQCQYDALVSIIFNRGPGKETTSKKPEGVGFKGGPLWKNYLKKGIFTSDDQDILEEMREDLINDGSSLAGGTRRQDEADLYFECIYKK